MGRPKLDLAGKQFGSLTALRLSEDTSPFRRKDAVWDAQCSCGNIEQFPAATLKSNKASQCRECTYLSRDHKSASWKTYFLTYLRNANKKGREFDLTPEKVKDIAERECHYCGAPPSEWLHSVGKYICSIKKKNPEAVPKKYLVDAKTIYANGLDRVDNSRGYTEDNVVACCSVCNYAKRDMSHKEFITWVNAAYKHLRSKNDL